MSLRLRLLAIIGVCLVVLWSAVAAWMLLDLRHEMGAAMDDRLAASARMVASGPHLSALDWLIRSVWRVGVLGVGG